MLTTSDEEAGSGLAREARVSPQEFRVLLQSLLKQDTTVNGGLFTQEKGKVTEVGVV